MLGQNFDQEADNEAEVCRLWPKSTRLHFNSQTIINYRPFANLIYNCTKWTNRNKSSERSFYFVKVEGQTFICHLHNNFGQRVSLQLELLELAANWEIHMHSKKPAWGYKKYKYLTKIKKCSSRILFIWLKN